MRNMEFKMERQGLLTVGQEVDVTEVLCQRHIIIRYSQ